MCRAGTAAKVDTRAVALAGEGAVPRPTTSSDDFNNLATDSVDSEPDLNKRKKWTSSSRRQQQQQHRIQITPSPNARDDNFFPQGNDLAATENVDSPEPDEQGVNISRASSIFSVDSRRSGSARDVASEAARKLSLSKPVTGRGGSYSPFSGPGERFALSGNECGVGDCCSAGGGCFSSWECTVTRKLVWPLSRIRG